MPLDEVAAALATATATSPRWRMEVTERADGVTVVNDAYNANPDSMRAALKALAAIGRGRPAARTVAVLGEMRELGASSRRGARRGRPTGRAARHRTSSSWSGEGAEPIHLGRLPRGLLGRASRCSCPTPDAALALLREQLRAGRRRAGQGVAGRRAASGSPTRCWPTGPSGDAEESRR